MTLIALPVVDKQYWILKENDRKVGNVEACAGGYQVKIHDQVAQYKTIRMVEQRVNIYFETINKSIRQKENLVYGYSVPGRMYNPMWDIPQKLPIYTKTAKSKSWFAAGWYCVKKGRAWQAIQGPKLIMLQRYPYRGPYQTKEEAKQND
jgi:hypothetical protein